MNKKIFISILIISLISTTFSASEAVITVTKTYQTIRGFGGMNFPEWIGDLTEDQRIKAFRNGVDELGLTILRIHINDDPSKWSRAVPTAKYAQSQGHLIFASPWRPPESMLEEFNEGGRSGKRLMHDKYAEYAEHLNNFVSFMKENEIDLYAISIQNEPDYGHEWTWWTSKECVDFLANYSQKINCKIMSPETFQYSRQYYTDILHNTEANKAVSVFGTHFYGTSKTQMNFPALINDPRDIWMTELYVPNSSSDADSWPEAVEVAVSIHNTLVKGCLNAYVWWYIRRSYGLLKEDGKISKRGYMIAHFSKFVRPGAVRVDATESPTGSVYVSAYKNIDGSLIIVTVNNSSESYAQYYKVEGFTIKSVDRYKTTRGENFAQTKGLELTGNGFYAQIDAKTVSTYYISSS